jgi:tRNA G18 (ribose-2'-O)-methylase SpoU
VDARARHLSRLGARCNGRGAGHIAIIPVGDSRDPRVADYRNIPDPELLARCGIFIAEGRLVVHRLLTHRRFATRSVMVTETALDGVHAVTATRPDLPVYVVPQHVMNEIAGFNIHRGCLAVGERPAHHSWRDVAARANRLVVLERVGDADNVGSTFRSAAAFGMDAVLLNGASADPLYRKAIRTSMGATLLIPFARIGAGPTPHGEWPAALGELRRDGMVVVALTPSSSTPPLQSLADRLSGQRVALVLGHEGDGLTREALEVCELRARIPMTTGADSINIATAAAIAMYELGRSDG